ncbi:LPS export ABC transporter periplasmic protein LptC [Dolichospermum circinale CS-1225]|uniref:LPS export ABC transporter periplasmic protein LptC n=1 Tax=Dolichospermum circinale CS-537/01 TaxID=3021739 RepID=A0ABT5A5B1_9CYAN|nr:LPS export ABC transporter periplasmic protein LptC [Dolichospermum circinale]MDB9457114.1 LPS export ABC transporter periplasmic protein LptC [Dolichospermum circinale CS-545/17]MDB9468338.1 LPS export ABC transporter periplasmic protein LptC [Dolichospermum circinale CS-539/09]MDB9469801.1 LPS export ABC transporter periplasmic protein LptC [Dolichospermum circinale CS-539]MDB9486705.1 LPS export ABC transporter periplasmic protein LptC [Dolichospermum circinale CS-537/01]MDB9520916.1 LPS
MQYSQDRENGRQKSKRQRGNQHHFPDFYSFSQFRLPTNWVYLSLSLCLGLWLSACGNPSAPNQSKTNTSSPKEDETKLTFFGVALEQFDETGRPIWKVKAKEAKYTTDKQMGQAQSPQGELYQDGKVVYQIKAEKADIKQDGKQLFLQGKIVATDPRNGIVFQGNELEWRPQEDLLIVRNQLNGSHKQLQATAHEAKVKTREQRVEFSGGVVAKSTDPQLQMRTEHLIWQIKDDKLFSDRSIQIERYQDNKISGRSQGNAAEINLKTQIAILQPQAKLELVNPLMQITSNSITWNIQKENITTNSPIRVFKAAENLTIIANQGKMNIPENTVYLTGNVNAVGQRSQSLKSNQLTWYLNKKLLEAKGNVIYDQVAPKLTFQGETAIGNLETENIVVKGGNSRQKVVTEIIPQENR